MPTTLEEWQEYSKTKFFQTLHFLKSTALALIYYSFLSFIFLSLYDRFGFERTLLVLLIGVFYVKLGK